MGTTSGKNVHITVNIAQIYCLCFCFYQTFTFAVRELFFLIVRSHRAQRNFLTYTLTHFDDDDDDGGGCSVYKERKRERDKKKKEKSHTNPQPC